ncbi:MAG: hypothetical protein KA974_08805 [Saprospiraceae bacterium]|nr:hypothetical protein [Saprospiraceae bacterium]
MYNKHFYLLIVGATLLFIGCLKPPDYPDEPVITFVGLSKNTLKQDYLLTDSLLLSFSFTDGDGDLGFETSDTSKSVVLIDSRDGQLANSYKLPFIPQQGASNGISGTVTLTVFTTCCYFSNGQIPCEPSTQQPTDTLVYELYVKDRAGHISNKISTSSIIVFCD